MRFLVQLRYFGETKLYRNFCLKIWRLNVAKEKRNNIRTYRRAICSEMSTGFIWLSTETFRLHHCARLSDAVSPWFWNNYTDSFTWIWTVQLLITTDKFMPDLESTVLLLFGQGADIRRRQTSDMGLSVWWRHCPEILRRNPRLNPQHIASVLRVL